MIQKIEVPIKIRPLIKWTGGKYDEYSKFSQFIPEFNNYYEPFFGGGGVFFALQPNKKSFLNDKSSDLIKFYSQINNSDFKTEMEIYIQSWEQTGKLSKIFVEKLVNTFSLFIQEKTSLYQVNEKSNLFFYNIDIQSFSPLFDAEFCLNVSEFKTALINSILDKTQRIKKICIKENRVFNNAELSEHLETGLKSGLFLYLRSIMNKCNLGTLKLSAQKEVATWYFVREFCYASMFRFNAKGEFNIPYGGIAYNSKNYKQKVDAIFHPKVKQLFLNAKISNLDFADFFSKHKPKNDDFVFLDPPYDSEFSEYDNNSFTKLDQIRLRDVLKTIECKWMLVIKETEFITNLYKEIDANIIDFDKTYTYNVRGRNSRDTKHLIISNYKI
jgi:DNA adenine methylase